MLFGLVVPIAALGALGLAAVNSYGLAEGSFLGFVLLQLAILVQKEIDLFSLHRFPLAALAPIRVLPL